MDNTMNQQSSIKFEDRKKEQEYLLKLNESFKAVTKYLSTENLLQKELIQYYSTLSDIIEIYAIYAINNTVQKAHISAESGFPMYSNILTIANKALKEQKHEESEETLKAEKKEIMDNFIGALYLNNIELIETFQKDYKRFYEKERIRNIKQFDTYILKEKVKTKAEFEKYQIHIADYPLSTMTPTTLQVIYSQLKHRNFLIKENVNEKRLAQDINFPVKKIYKLIHSKYIYPEVIQKTDMRFHFGEQKHEEKIKNILKKDKKETLLEFRTTTFENIRFALSLTKNELLEATQRRRRKDSSITERKIYVCSKNIVEQVEEYALNQQNAFKILEI